MLPTFPYSPLPAALQRTINWGENITTYDSGEYQGDTPFQKPLIVWSIPIELMLEMKQSSLWNFANDRRGMTRPFLIKDAYEYNVGSGIIAANSGVTNTATLYFRDSNSFTIRPDSHFVGSLSSVFSGYVSQGNEYSINQDEGIITVNTKAPGDVWFVNSGTEYFRKARFSSQYSDTAKLWNIFTANLSIVELP